MAAGTSPIFVKSVETATQDIVNADGTTVQDLVTAGADGARVFSVSAATDDTAAVELQLFVQRDGAGGNFLLGTIQAAVGSGNSNAVPATDLLGSNIKGLDADGSLILGGLDKLRVAPKVAVTAAKTVWVVASYGDY